MKTEEQSISVYIKGNRTVSNYLNQDIDKSKHNTGLPLLLQSGWVGLVSEKVWVGPCGQFLPYWVGLLATFFESMSATIQTIQPPPPFYALEHSSDVYILSQG